MLFKPVYVKPKPRKMQEAPIPMGNPPKAKTPSPEPAQPPPEPVEPTSPTTDKIPMVISGTNGTKTVIPTSATRDVLSGRVAYYLVEDSGLTLFKPKHIFAALKLNREKQVRFEDYGCIGGHQRVLEVKPKKKIGLGYRRRFISPEVFRRGIFNERTRDGSGSSWAPSLLKRGTGGPRA